MIKFLLGLIGGLPSLLGKGLDVWAKKVDAGVETTRINTGAARDVTVEVLKNDAQRTEGQVADRRSMMAHPIWWVAWGAFVAPVALYKACIFWVSTFPGLGWTILKVPAAELEDARLIVLSFFGLYAANALLDRVLSAWKR